LAELQWHQNGDTSLCQMSSQDPNTDPLCSPFLHLCDSPILHASTFVVDGDETITSQPIWNPEEASEQIEDDATIDSLFDEYLHPTSFSTPDLTKGSIDETCQIVLGNLEDKDPGVATEPLTEVLDQVYLEDTDQKKNLIQ
jgi:hypothetical protein